MPKEARFINVWINTQALLSNLPNINIICVGKTILHLRHGPMREDLHPWSLAPQNEALRSTLRGMATGGEGEHSVALSCLPWLTLSFPWSCGSDGCSPVHSLQGLSPAIHLSVLPPLDPSIYQSTQSKTKFSLFVKVFSPDCPRIAMHTDLAGAQQKWLQALVSGEALPWPALRETFEWTLEWPSRSKCSVSQSHALWREQMKTCSYDSAVSTPSCALQVFCR